MKPLLQVFRPLACGLLVSLASSPARVAAESILPLGNSITEGGSGGGYRSYLEDLLIANSKSYDFVGTLSGGVGMVDPQHEGHSSWRTDQIVEGPNHGPENFDASGSGKLETWLGTYTPDIVLLHIGTNDAIQYYQAANQTPPAADMFNDMSSPSFDSDGGAPKMYFDTHPILYIEEMIDLLYADNNDVKIFLAKIVGNSNANYDANIQALNNQIGDLATAKNNEHSGLVTVVDMYTAVGSNLSDGTHPSGGVGGGYDLMAQAWYNAIQGELSSVPEPEEVAVYAALSLLGLAILRNVRTRKRA